MKFTLLNGITFLVITGMFSLATAGVESLIFMKYISGILMGASTILLICVVKLIKSRSLSR